MSVPSKVNLAEKLKLFQDQWAPLLLFERAGTVNTGNVVNERTLANPERI